MKELTVLKESPNKGRPFRTCTDDDCGFFQWMDGNPDSLTPRKRPRLPSHEPYNYKRRKITIDDLDDELRAVIEAVIIGMENQ